jgi:hypothetical protein
MGVVGVIALSSMRGNSPAPTLAPSQAKIAPRKAVASARKPVSAKPAEVAAAPKAVRAPVKPSSGIHAFIDRIEDTLSPSATETGGVEPAPETAVAQAPPAPRAAAIKEKAKAAPAPKPSAPAPRHAPAATPDAMARLKRTIATVGDKIKGIDRTRPKASGETAPDGGKDAPATDDGSMVAMAPPMVTTPDMPKAPPAPARPSDPDAEALASARTNNPVSDTLTKLAEPPKKQKTEIDEMVEQINANALSAASTARQIKWKFAKYKF